VVWSFLRLLWIGDYTNSFENGSGKITIRLRIEYESFQKFGLGALTFRPINHINLARINDFRAAYFVCNGEEDLNRFSMEYLTAYRTELEELMGLTYYVRQAVLTVIFWRGHKTINFCGMKVKLPLHSIFAFLMGTTVIENFNLFPSYSLFCISWLLAATNEMRLANPSPWHGKSSSQCILYMRKNMEDI
jgi:hypothetical protein